MHEHGVFTLVLTLLLLGAANARAETSPRQLSVLPAGGDDSHSMAVDAALHEALASRLPDTTLQTSAVPLEEVQLVAGCGDDEAACLQLIAKQLGSDALLVRRVSAEPGGTTQLSLTAFTTSADGALARSRQESTSIDWTELQAAERAVLSLLAKLELTTSEPEPVVELAPTEPIEPVMPAPFSADNTRADHSRWPTRIGWTLTAVGCGLLGAGLISGALSRRDEHRYAHVTIDGAQAVDDAHSYLSSAQHHAHVANGLFIGGAVIGVAGLATTLWHWAAVRRDQGSASLSVQSTRSGLMLVINGSWQGGS